MTDATAPTDPGEGDGTGSGPVEAHGGADFNPVAEYAVPVYPAEGLPKWEADLLERNAARGAAIRAAIEAISTHWSEAGGWYGQATYGSVAEAAVRAAEPHIRQAVAEEIARRIDELEDLDYETAAEVVRRDAAAAIAREVGRER